MSGEPSEDELERIREQKREQLKERAQQPGDEDGVEAQRQQAEAQKKAILRQNLTDGARKRLNSVKMSKPDVGERVEQQVIALARSNRVKGQIDEDQMKELLRELTPDSKSYDIKRR